MEFKIDQAPPTHQTIAEARQQATETLTILAVRERRFKAAAWVLVTFVLLGVTALWLGGYVRMVEALILACLSGWHRLAH